ncbi:hypothetical protein M409DRAFT_16218 [Zasmidium cellare ATCC 36951]|uniref:Amidohydrolase-related domain-containing protein n=1 Tax=Zasmidium cellare ATCC 36951 TaxID=1080233 RepID=A0A6A6D695_ZASCE|nr:uncharacterized protein M409DRAFT_16218 [Zasmidium cellare ATCC 36951]KAF2173948.1 hypothetical protein M409DRAFT_16218 [Zasmidium cellare ATCC 36951]
MAHKTTTNPGLLSLEDHFVSSICQQDEIASTISLHVFPKLILDKLLDVGPKRLDDMKSIKEHHPRFAGFATFPMANPESIVDELERCVKDLNFAGALIPNSANGRYYDGPEYLAMWQAAEQLDVPIYLHPCPPSEEAKPKFRGNYSGNVAFAVGTHAWDWHSDYGAHFIRLFASGLFDRFPKLKIVLGHMGEMLPFMLGRIERKLALTKDSSSWRSTFRQVYAHNVWITTSGLYDIEVFKLVLAITSVGKIMFSVDYPFESSETSARFMREVQESHMVTEEELELIEHGNAEKLLGIGAVAWST